MMKKSDAMLQHEKWIEETMKNKPKHSREGLPIQPIHGLFFLCAVLVILVVIGSLLHHELPKDLACFDCQPPPQAGRHSFKSKFH